MPGQKREARLRADVPGIHVLRICPQARRGWPGQAAMTMERTFEGLKMKLTFSPASPFARKVRIAAIELGLIDQIEFAPATVVPGQPSDEYSKLHPLKKLPVLILNNGEVIVDSYVIVEYLDELAGGGKLIPASGPMRW